MGRQTSSFNPFGRVDRLQLERAVTQKVWGGGGRLGIHFFSELFHLGPPYFSRLYLIYLVLIPEILAALAIPTTLKGSAVLVGKWML